MIEYYSRKKGTKSIEKIPGFIDGCWINVVDPSEEEKDFLVKRFRLNKDSLIDGLDIYENSRIEIEGKKVYIFLSSPTEKILNEDVSSFLVIYQKDYLITLSKYPLEIIEKTLDPNKKVLTFSSSRNLLRILFFVSKSFEDSVRKIIKEVKKNKADLAKLNYKDIEKLIHHENRLNNYISSFRTIIQNYDKIMKNKSIKFPEREKILLEDLIIDLNQSFNLSTSILKTTTNMRDYYSTELSVNLNKTITTLTIFTIFLTIPMIISSIYGMNIHLPFQQTPSIFFALVGSVLLIWGILFIVLRLLKIV